MSQLTINRTGPSAKGFLTAREAADAFGVSVRTVMNWAREGKVEFIQNPGGMIFIHESEVDRFFEGGFNTIQVPPDKLREDVARRLHEKRQMDERAAFFAKRLEELTAPKRKITCKKRGK